MDKLNADMLGNYTDISSNRIVKKSVGNYKQKVNGEPYVGRTDSIQDFIGAALDIAKEQALKLLPIVVGLGISAGAISGVMASNTYDDYKVEKNEIANESLELSAKFDYDDYLKENKPSLKEKISVVEEIKDTRDELKEDYDSKLDEILNANKIYEDAVSQVAEEHFKDEVMASRQK